MSSEVILLKEDYPVARKQHRCDFCGGIIDVGEKYVSQHCKLDDVYVYKMHLHCKDAAQIADPYNECEGDDYVIDTMVQHLKDGGIEVPKETPEIVNLYLKRFENVKGRN